MIYGLKESDVDRVKAIFGGFPEIDKAILYGSRAKGNFKPASDIDLTLIGESLNLTVLNRIEVLLDDLLLPYTFDISIFSQISNVDLQEHIQRIGLEFYTKNA
jgi:predicted nucleotidyltransferase